MDLIAEGLRDALQLLIDMDSAVVDAAIRSLWVSATAVGLAALLGVPFGTLLARRNFPGRRLCVLGFRVGMSLPTVLVGLIGFTLLSRRGPLGPLELLYTPWAIVIGEWCLALPIIVTISHGAVTSLDPRVGETARTLGAGRWRRFGTYVSEARMGISLAVLTAFARCVTELGIAMMVGGNIKGRTRTLSTATALETGQGEFGRGIAMGLILITIALGVTLLISMTNQEDEAP